MARKSRNAGNEVKSDGAALGFEAKMWEAADKLHSNLDKAIVNEVFSNRVRLALFVRAYNLDNFLRRFALPKEVSHWSLSSIQLKLVKIGAKIIGHSKMTVFQMAEVAVPEKLFRSMLSRIHRLEGYYKVRRRACGKHQSTVPERPD